MLFNGSASRYPFDRSLTMNILRHLRNQKVIRRLFGNHNTLYGVACDRRFAISAERGGLIVTHDTNDRGQRADARQFRRQM